MLTAPRLLKLCDVRAGDAEIDAADHHVALLLGIDQRLADAFAGGFEIDDLAFAHAARRRLADAENLHRAVAAGFADDGADFGGADFESDDDVFSSHCRRNGFCSVGRRLVAAGLVRVGFGRGGGRFRVGLSARPARLAPACRRLRLGAAAAADGCRPRSGVGIVEGDRHVALDDEVHGLDFLVDRLDVIEAGD